MYCGSRNRSSVHGQRQELSPRPAPAARTRDTRACRPVHGRSAVTKCGFGRKRTSNTRSASAGVPCLNPKLDHVHQQRRGRWRAADRLQDAASQLVDRQPARVDDLVGEPSHRLQQPPLVGDAVRHRRRGAQRMRAARLAEPPQDARRRWPRGTRGGRGGRNAASDAGRPAETAAARCPPGRPRRRRRRWCLRRLRIRSAKAGISATGRLSTQK